MIAKLETLVDELTEFTREARAYLKRCAPLDWTLLYGPRGTEIRKPNEPDEVEIEIR